MRRSISARKPKSKAPFNCVRNSSNSSAERICKSGYPTSRFERSFVFSKFAPLEAVERGSNSFHNNKGLWPRNQNQDRKINK